MYYNRKKSTKISVGTIMLFVNSVLFYVKDKMNFYLILLFVWYIIVSGLTCLYIA